MAIDEREQQIAPVVAESVQHNTKTISQIRSLTSSLFGVAAGTLGLESWPGFLFYAVASTLVSALLWVFLVGADPRREKEFFRSSLSDLWLAGVFEGVMGYVLTWTLFFGLVRA